MTRAHSRTEQIGLTITNHLAPAVTVALEHLRREQQICDGFAARGESAGRGSSITSSTEGAAMMASRYRQDSADIHNAIERLDQARAELARLVFVMRAPAALEQKRCRDGQHGRDSGLWSDDPACLALPEKKDLCTKHYWAWRRYRIAHGIDTSGDFEEAV
jgi:hypothetical protein